MSLAAFALSTRTNITTTIHGVVGWERGKETNRFPLAIVQIPRDNCLGTPLANNLPPHAIAIRIFSVRDGSKHEKRPTKNSPRGMISLYYINFRISHNPQKVLHVHFSVASTRDGAATGVLHTLILCIRSSIFDDELAAFSARGFMFSFLHTHRKRA